MRILLAACRGVLRDVSTGGGETPAKACPNDGMRAKWASLLRLVGVEGFESVGFGSTMGRREVVSFDVGEEKRAD